MQGSWLRVLVLLLFAMLFALLAGWWMARDLRREGLLPTLWPGAQETSATSSASDEIYPAADAVVFPGMIAPYKTKSVTSSITAPIAQLPVQEGSLVRKGQLLCSLEEGEIRRQWQETKSVYLKAQDQLRTLKKNHQPQAEKLDTELQLAQRDLENYRQETTVELQRMERAVNQATREWEEAKMLYQTRKISGEQLSSKATTLTQAQSELLAQRTSHTALLQEKESEVEKARLALQNIVLSLAACESKVQTTQAAWTRQQQRLNATQIIAPITGTVHLLASVHDAATLQYPKPGICLSQGEPFLEIADIGPACVKIEITESDVANLWIGLPATITGEGLGDLELPGEVVQIQPAAKAAEERIFPVTVLINASRKETPLGLPVDVKLHFDASRPKTKGDR
jgi:HlyD family secretion protein